MRTLSSIYVIFVFLGIATFALAQSDYILPKSVKSTRLEKSYQVECNIDDLFTKSVEMSCYEYKPKKDPLSPFARDGVILLHFAEHHLAAEGWKPVSHSKRKNITHDVWGDDASEKNFYRNTNPAFCDYEISIKITQPVFPKEFYTTIEAYKIPCEDK